MGIFPQWKKTDDRPSSLSQAVEVIMLSAVELGSVIGQYYMLFLV